MNCNLLIDPLPESVEIDGKEYPIRSDFRTSMLFELLITDDGISDIEKTLQAIRLYYDNPPDNLQGAVEQLIWFYSCGQVDVRKDGDGDEPDGGGNSAERIYSFEYDAPYIYAAFMEQYGIDLCDTDLHWWKFRALFSSLNRDTKFGKIMEYRGVDTKGSKMSKEQKDFYRKMKKLYALPLSQAETDRQNALVEALQNGGDLTGLV
ncbi:MAG: bacteriophage Gp15 family protein [Bacteroidales bacterium]|nr:bacteriophage Gp15 family protein [Bacteroidales bacterium]